MVEISTLMRKDNVIAVIGASRHKEKYGYKVFMQLLKEDYKVYGVNPNTDEIEGHKIYSSLQALPEKPDLVITIVPPQVTEATLPKIAELGIKNVWMQPGSESPKALEECKRLGLNCIHDLCYVRDGLKMEFSL